MSRILFSILLLALTYNLALGSFDPIDVIMGVLIAIALVLGFRRFLFDDQTPPPPGLLRRIAAFGPFLFALIIDILRGTWLMITVVLGIKPLTQPGIVSIPIADRTPTGVAVSALCTTLSPGTFLIDVDWEKGVFLLHSIDASDPDEVRESHQHFYYRYQRHVFP